MRVPARGPRSPRRLAARGRRRRACGTSTSTPTTPAPPSRRASGPGARTGSRSRTSASRSPGSRPDARGLTARSSALPAGGGPGRARPRGGRGRGRRRARTPPVHPGRPAGDPAGPRTARSSCCRTIGTPSPSPRPPPSSPGPAALRVAVLPSRACVQVLAALAVHDDGRRFEEDVVAMTAAARATRTGAVTWAVRESLTSVGHLQGGRRARAGRRGGRPRSDRRSTDVARGLLDRLLSAGGELVTLVAGAAAADDLTPSLRGLPAADPPRGRGRRLRRRPGALPAAAGGGVGPCCPNRSRRCSAPGDRDVARLGASASRPWATCSATTRAGTTAAGSSPTSAASRSARTSR